MSLNHGDLKGTILPDISIDEFEPKAGDETDVIVIAFYSKDQDPAEDLNTFIQRGFIDTLDVEVSPNTDEDGRYLIFVEMSRDDTFPNKFQALLKDIENVTGKLDWSVRTYLANDTIFKFNDPTLFNYIILQPESYVSRDKFKMNDIKENINQFFQDALMSDLTLDGNTIIISHNRQKIIAEVVDVGDYDVIIGRNFLKESAFGVGQNSYEANVLQSILGNCNVISLGEYLCVSHSDKIMLLKDTQLKY